MQTVALVVAYNRAELLAECLDALHHQTHRPDHILVVDNASTDNSYTVATQHEAHPVVVQLSRNTGGAGGFCAALALAHERFDLADDDVFWIMDDDTIPTPGALEALLRVYTDFPERPAVLSSQVLWTDGSLHPMNTHRERPFTSQSLRVAAQSYHARVVRAASFVSVLCEVGAVRAQGLPVSSYFIWNDDLEYTARLLKDRVGLHVFDSEVIHKTKALASATDAPGDRFYYEVRNKLWMLWYSQGLRWYDRCLYGASMCVRWAKMFLKSSNRAHMKTLAWSAIHDARTSRPERNADFFADMPEVAHACSLLERN